MYGRYVRVQFSEALASCGMHLLQRVRTQHGLQHC
jgi:hypothetical protein